MFLVRWQQLLAPLSENENGATAIFILFLLERFIVSLDRVPSTAQSLFFKESVDYLQTIDPPPLLQL